MSDIRISPPRVFGGATRAARPPIDAAGSADAHRQAAFVLGADLDCVLQGLNLEAAVANASSAARFRTQRMISALGLWSRSWLSRLEALHALEWGNYPASVTLIRAAADYQASALYLLRTNNAEWEEWLDQGGIGLVPADHATEYRLHAFRAAEILAAHDILGPLYRAAMDISMPHFGATLLLAANESDPARVLMTFGDRDFHLGLAELCLGWLELLGVAQLDALLEFEGVFSLPDAAALASWTAGARALAARGDRCSIQVVERDGQKRYLVTNWRRASGGAPKRILL